MSHRHYPKKRSNKPHGRSRQSPKDSKSKRSPKSKDKDRLQRRIEKALEPTPAIPDAEYTTLGKAPLSTEEIQEFFMTDKPLQAHVNALHYNRDRYVRQLRLFMNHKVMLVVSTPTKAKVIAALSIRNEKELLNWLLSFPR